jgi:hypothetical protein
MALPALNQEIPRRYALPGSQVKEALPGWQIKGFCRDDKIKGSATMTINSPLESFF